MKMKQLFLLLMVSLTITSCTTSLYSMLYEHTYIRIVNETQSNYTIGEIYCDVDDYYKMSTDHRITYLILIPEGDYSNTIHRFSRLYPRQKHTIYSIEGYLRSREQYLGDPFMELYVVNIDTYCMTPYYSEEEAREDASIIGGIKVSLKDLEESNFTITINDLLLRASSPQKTTICSIN